MTSASESALVTPAWLEEQRAAGADVRLIEIAGIGQDDLQAYRAGHIPGAAGWAWKEMLWDSHRRDFPTPEEFASRLGKAGIANDTTVVFYGEPMQFGIYAWWTFRYCGHAGVKVLDGGRSRWQGEGRALDTEPAAAPKPVTYRPVQRSEDMRIGREGVLALLAAPKAPAHVILDGRSAEEYSGQRVGAPGNPDVGALRYGRIPGAKHLMFEELLGPDKRFRPEGEIRAAVEARGVRPEKEVITYCRMSHRATVLYFALTELLGYERVQVYDGSWTEWGNLVGVPVER